MRSLRFLVLFAVAAALTLADSTAFSQSPAPVAIVEIKGLIDPTMAAYVERAIEDQSEAGAQLVVLELSSPGATSDDIYGLLDLLADPPLPVAVWIGAAPAEAFGGAGQMVAAASIGAAAPGVEIGYLSPTVAGAADDQPVQGPEELRDETVTVTEPIPGFVDFVEPALGQFVAALDGVEVTVRGEQVVLSTVVEDTDPSGETVTHPVETRFLEPGLGVRIARIGLSPDAAYFLLVVGLSVAAFEFYALGPGVAAAVAALSLLLSGYALVNLPLTWWAIPAALAGMAAYVSQFQRTARVGWGTALGSLLLLAGGLGLTAADPQFGPTWWITLLSVATVAFFFVIALPAVSRARLSTPTIGRSHLVGRRGIAASDFVDGDGTAEIEGARWRAASHREAGLSQGDHLEVTGVEGTYLLVDPAPGREKIPGD